MSQSWKHSGVQRSAGRIRYCSRYYPQEQDKKLEEEIKKRFSSLRNK